MRDFEIDSCRQADSNTPVTNTEIQELTACVDWLQATFFTENPRAVVEQILGLDFDSFFESSFSRLGYRKAIFNGAIFVLYDGYTSKCGITLSMGVHVVMSGKACRQFENLNGEDWRIVIRRMLLFQAQFTRLDIALDDMRKNAFSIQNVEKKVKRGELVSPFRTTRSINKYRNTTGESEGITLYFGSEKSDVMVRMYDKKLEMEGKDELIKGKIEKWNRTEIQLRHDRAMRTAEILAYSDDIGVEIRGVLLQYLKFKKPLENDCNASRWPLAKWWATFLGDVEPVSIVRLQDKLSSAMVLKKKEDWIKQNVSRSLALLFEAYEYTIYDMIPLFEIGKSKLTAYDEKLIKDFLQSKKPTKKN